MFQLVVAEVKRTCRMIVLTSLSGKDLNTFIIANHESTNKLLHFTSYILK